ncbi:hypothetical protein CUMW_283050, partial [Citrus unshiu]
MNNSKIITLFETYYIVYQLQIIYKLIYSNSTIFQ